MDACAVWAIFPSNQWSTTGPPLAVAMCHPVGGKVCIKDLLLLIGMSSLCCDSRFPLKKYFPMTICLISNNRGVLKVALNKTNFCYYFLWFLDHFACYISLSVHTSLTISKMHNSCLLTLIWHGSDSFTIPYAFQWIRVNLIILLADNTDKIKTTSRKDSSSLHWPLRQGAA